MSGESVRTRAMPLALVVTVIALAGVLWYYRDTVASMLAIWQTSETYAHGWVILPISLWLIWRQRDCLLSIQPRFNPLGLGVMAVAASLWVAADIVGAQVVQHFTLVLMTVATVLTVLGWQATRQLSFPLAFLVFAVPFGEVLIPTLMEITAVFAVTAVKLSGIPVFREGMFFALPSGDFEVAVACSGIRYLIASMALGTLYAYLSFRSLKKRLLFILLAAVVPIVANGLRAYMIVMLAHLSDMKLAVGIDHFVYGWVFFGLVMFALFMLGARFQEESAPTLARGGASKPSPVFLTAVAAGIVVSIAMAIPAGAGAWRQVGAVDGMQALFPRARDPWVGPLPPTLDYRPMYHGASQRAAARYQGPSGDVHVFIEYYSATEADAELINELNRVYGGDWVREDIGSRRDVGDTGHRVIETPLRRRSQELGVWHWYEIDGKATVSGSSVKLRMLRDTLLGTFRGSALVAIVAADESAPGAAAEIMTAFAKPYLKPLRACLYDGRADGVACERP